jgi:glycosyltransferase involved in cell wall biosynthesis
MSGRHLLVTTHTPILTSGRAVRTYGVARALAEHGGLDLLYKRFEGDRPDARFDAIADCTMHEVISLRSPRRALAYARGRRAGVPASLARGISPELAEAAARLADSPGRGLVVADGPVAAAALTALAERREVIYNAHNFESGFRHEAGMNENGSPAELQRFERRLLERAAESWMVSHADLEKARELCPEAGLRYMPNVVDVAAIEPIPDDERAAHPRRAMFIANFAYAPNQSGLRFLLDEVMPRVWEELPDARLSLAGGGLEGFNLSDERIETHGFVSDLHAVYAEASCVLVPLLLGGGTPLKLVEGLAYGVPMVVTPRAVRGLAEVEHGEHCLVAEGGEAYAEAVVSVLRDGAPELGRNARALAEREFSIEALGALLP